MLGRSDSTVHGWYKICVSPFVSCIIVVYPCVIAVTHFVVAACRVYVINLMFRVVALFAHFQAFSSTNYVSKACPVIFKILCAIIYQIKINRPKHLSTKVL